MTGFGKEIRKIRQTAGETIEQTAGAIGIDRSHLSKIELGQDRPSERIAQHLIAHFSVSGVKGFRLMELAGFKSGFVSTEHNRGKEDSNMDNAQVSIAQPQPANVTIDASKPTHYTDSVFVNSTDFGMVLDFARRIGPEQHNVVTSVGMSFEHAKKLAEVLNNELEKHER